MNKKILCFILCAALLLSGCVYRSAESGDTGLAVYRLETSESGSRLVRQYIEKGEEDTLVAVAQALSQNGKTVFVESALPEGVTIENLSYEQGRASIYLSPGYKDLSSMEALLAESAIVLSLCALDKVCFVDIYCGGSLEKASLAPEKYSEADGLCAAYERSLKLYLPGEEGKNLVPVSVTVMEDGSVNGAERVMDELLSQLDGMENTKIKSLALEGGVCSIDLSHEFYGAEPAESLMGMLMIYSVVNSLCRVPGVEAVSLSVDGYPVESYGGFRIHWPLSDNLSLVNY